jgi:zinc and cadmium transporter
MRVTWLYTLSSVFGVSLISFVGLFTFGMRSEHVTALLIYFISFAAGALFGDAFFHLIPEIVRTQGFGFSVSVSFLGGIVVFLIIEKSIHLQQYHSHGTEGHAHEEPEGKIRPFVFTNIFGDTIHNFGDGVIIGASYLVSVPVGLATTFAVAFHEIPHEIGNFSILVHGGFSRGKALFVNFLTALVAVIGAVVALALSDYVDGIQRFVLPIAAGGFIYVAGSDLIPELHKESDSLRKIFFQLLVFILGIALMALLLLLEK